MSDTSQLCGAANRRPPVPAATFDGVELQRLLRSPSHFIEMLPVAVYACDAAGRILWFNRRAADLWGRAPAIGDDADRFCGSHRLHLNGKVIAHSECPMANVLRTGESVRGPEVVIEHADGSTVRAMVHIEAVKDDDGRVIGAINCFHDVTELRRAEALVTESGYRARQLLEALPAAVYTTDAEGVVTYCNQAAVDLVGRSPLIGKDRWCVSWRLYRPDGTPLPPEECPMAVALQERRPVRNVEIIAERPDGSRAPVMPFPTPLYDASGNFAGAVNMLVDITELKQAEALLVRRMEEQEALYGFTERLFRAVSLEQICEAALDAIARALRTDRAAILLCDEAGVMRFAAWRGLSETYRRAVEGHSPWRADEIDPQPICVADVDLVDESESLKAVIRHEGIKALSFTPLVVGGKISGKFMTYYDTPHPFSHGEVDLALAIARQLGFGIERMRTEEARAQLAAIIESSDDAIISADLDGVITSWNRGAERVFGYSAEEVVGKPEAILIPESHRHELPDVLDRIRNNERVQPYETVRRRKDGGLLDVSLTISPVKAASGTTVGASKIARDITRQKRATERLHTLNRIAKFLASDLDIESIVQTVTDSATALSGARFGAFFYNCVDAEGERYTLYALSGAPRDAFSRFGLPRNTAIFEPTFRGTGIVRSDDIRKDPRYGRNSPHRGMPKGHLPVVSYLAVPVVSRSGEVLGGLFFGHEKPGIFTEESEQVVAGIASHAAIAIDNARLLQRAQQEIEQRRRTEEELRKNEERARARAAELQAIMEAVPAVIWIARDRECRSMIGNRASHEFLRLPPDANPSLTAPEDERPGHFEVLVDGRVLAPEELPVQRAARGEEVRDFEVEVRFGGSTSRYLLGNATTLRDGCGEPCGAVAAFVDVTDRRHADTALRESEQRLKMALKAGRMGAWEWDIQSGRVIWSAGLEEIHGLPPGGFGGTFEDFRRDIHPKDRDAVLQQIERELKTGEDHHLVYRIRRPDGAVRWLESFGIFSRDADGTPCKLAGVCMDITERKQAEEQHTLMVHELNHRVKNTLATVQSLGMQTLRSTPSSADAMQVFEARLTALARAHDVLTSQRWEGASLSEIVRRALEPFQTEGRRISVSGPEVRISPKQALALSMALHELATNAAKYGALFNDEGRVVINWLITASDGLDRLELVWKEEGGPPVAPPRRKGFGTRMIERNLAGELDGEVSQEYLSEGVVCRIRSPLAPQGEQSSAH